MEKHPMITRDGKSCFPFQYSDQTAWI